MLDAHVNNVQVVIDGYWDHLCDLVALHRVHPLLLLVPDPRFSQPTLPKLLAQLLPRNVEEAVARMNVARRCVRLEGGERAAGVDGLFLVEGVEETMLDGLLLLRFLPRWSQIEVGQEDVSRSLIKRLLNKLKGLRDWLVTRVGLRLVLE